MRNSFFLFVLGLALVGVLPACAQLQPNPVLGNTVPPNHVILTVDDAPSITCVATGVSLTRSLIQALDKRGCASVQFIVLCHFKNFPPYLRDSLLCTEAGTEDESLIDEITDSGNHMLGNHTFSHPDLAALNRQPNPTAYPNGIFQPGYLIYPVKKDVLLAQWYINRHKANYIGLDLFRCPFLACGWAEMQAIMAQVDYSWANNFMGVPYPVKLNDVDASKLIGPVWFDAGTGTNAFITAGGDWPEYIAHKAWQDTAADYISAIQPGYRGIVVLHIRTQFYNGADGDPWPLNLILAVVDYLMSHGFRIVPFDGIPGHLGNVRASQVEQVSSEFGIGNGQGSALFGDITGNGRDDVCKAFDKLIECATNDKPSRWQRMLSALGFSKPPTFRPSNSWFDTGDQNWVSGLLQKFWLVDINLDGKKDLLYPVDGGVATALSNGFNQFIRSDVRKLQLPQGGWTKGLLQSARFGDVDHDGHIDMVAVVSNKVVWWRGINGGFDQPKVLADLPAGTDWEDPKYGSTLLVGDLNGDGFSDLVIRGSLDVSVSLQGKTGFGSFTSWSKRFPDWQGLDNPLSFSSLTLVKINGHTALCAALESGIACQEVDENGKSRFRLYRYLNNEGYTTLGGEEAWHKGPKRHGEGLTFAVLDDTGKPSPVWMKADGLYFAPVVVLGKKKEN